MKIKLNADGSGTLTLIQNISELEYGIGLLHGELEEASVYKAITLEESVESVNSEPGRTGQKTRIFAFEDFAAALPELENEVPMMPRFSQKDGLLVAELRHEMNSLDGFHSDSETNAFYDLEIEFPVVPKSEGGVVEGNSVRWRVGADAIKEFHESEIGCLFFSCSVPESAVSLQLEPRLVVSRKKELVTKRSREPRNVYELNAVVPIVSEDASFIRQGSNARMGIYMAVDGLPSPLCYKRLTIEEFCLDGKVLDVSLKGEDEGVFSGTDSYGRDAPGLPVRFEFGQNSPWLKRVDRLVVSMLAAVPSQTQFYELCVPDAAGATNLVMSIGEQKVAIIAVEHRGMQGARVEFATDLAPTDLSMVYLDCAYGLRFPAKSIRWTRGQRIYSMNRSLGERVFGDKEFSVFTAQFDHIPMTSFALQFEYIDEVAFEEVVLREDNLDVK